MKAPPEIDPLAAFPDSKRAPRVAELAAALGPTFLPLGLILDRLQAAHPEVTAVWRFSARSGWYQVQLLKKRRLLYLLPQRGDFKLTLILGGKAVARLLAGPFARRVAWLLKTAKRYPEGTMFNFKGATADPRLLAALLEAKISPDLRGTDLSARVKLSHGSEDPCHLPTKSRQARKYQRQRT
ncbi:MAG TPA: DUF3788 family protein [Lacunisphaera sp.]